MVPTNSPKTKKLFPFSSRKKRKKDRTTQSEVALHVSSARVSKTPQLGLYDLSYAGKHLMFLVQHQVDAKKIKVSANQTSWNDLVMLNPDADDLEKRTKKLFAIKDFPTGETDEIARRVIDFVIEHQQEMVVK